MPRLIGNDFEPQHKIGRVEGLSRSAKFGVQTPLLIHELVLFCVRFLVMVVS